MRLFRVDHLRRAGPGDRSAEQLLLDDATRKEGAVCPLEPDCADPLFENAVFTRLNWNARPAIVPLCVRPP
jgi:hypothetical protein